MSVLIIWPYSYIKRLRPVGGCSRLMFLTLYFSYLNFEILTLLPLILGAGRARIVGSADGGTAT